MKEHQILGLVFLGYSLVLALTTNMWFIGLPFFVLGIVYLTKQINPDDKDE